MLVAVRSELKLIVSKRCTKYTQEIGEQNNNKNDMKILGEIWDKSETNLRSKQAGGNLEENSDHPCWERDTSGSLL